MLTCPINKTGDLMYVSKKLEENAVVLDMDFLIDGQISSFCPGHHEGWLLTLIMQRKLTQSL